MPAEPSHHIPATTPDIAPIAAIRIGERDRTDLGDLTELADSINAVGLLHPVVVTENLDLVAGGRRLAAVTQLGWTEVPVTVVDLTTVEQTLQAEWQENTCRKPLSPIEASLARERRAKLLAPTVQENRGGRPTKVASTGIPQDGFWAEPETGRNLRPVSAKHERKTTTVAAAGTGFSARSIDKVDEIRKVAEQGIATVGTGHERRDIEVPEPVREIARQKVVELSQAGTPIHPAHVEVRKVIESYIGDDPELKRLTLRRNFIAAQSKAADITNFDPEHLVYALEKDAEWDQLDRLQEQLNTWFAKVKAVRPRGLRVVGGVE